MATLKKVDGKWELRWRPHGRDGKNLKRRFATKAEAERFLSMAMAQVADPWSDEANTKVRDLRRLSDVVNRWFEVKGFGLASGENRRQSMLKVCALAGDPLVDTLDAAAWAKIRTARLAQGVSLSTTNHDLVHFKGVFSALAAVGEWDGPNPLAKVTKVKVKDPEMGYLDLSQVMELLDRLRGHEGSRDSYYVAKLSLATGARWGEAEGIRLSHLGRNLVTFVDTKNGKTRSVPVAAALLAELREYAASKGVRGSARVFSRCYGSFRYHIQRCSFDLPDQQCAHVLRHTFASHFVQAGGSILALQKILDHADLQTTMIYAHLAPDHLQEAVNLNPLAQLSALKQREI